MTPHPSSPPVRASAFSQAVAQIRTLLGQQREAILRADAQALPSLATQLHQRLCGLRPASPADVAALAPLRALLRDNQALLQSRQNQIAQTLMALGLDAASSGHAYTAAGFTQASYGGHLAHGSALARV